VDSASIRRRFPHRRPARRTPQTSGGTVPPKPAPVKRFRFTYTLLRTLYIRPTLERRLHLWPEALHHASADGQETAGRSVVSGHARGLQRFLIAKAVRVSTELPSLVGLSSETRTVAPLARFLSRYPPLHISRGRRTRRNEWGDGATSIDYRSETQRVKSLFSAVMIVQHGLSHRL
jgi:hypothetical protein